MSDNEKLDINTCFADDSGKEEYRFWDNFANKINVNVWEENCLKIYNYKNNYDSLPDPDSNSKNLYKFHRKLWGVQIEEDRFKKLNIPVLLDEIYTYQLDTMMADGRLSLSSDSIMSIYWHWTGKNYPLKQSSELMELIISEKYSDKLKEAIENMKKTICRENEKNFSEYKYFLWLYLQKSNTIGGYIVFPKHDNSINQERGKSQKIRDRFDLTLECVRRYYLNPENLTEEHNPLFYTLKKSEFFDKDKEFFKMFGSFKNYIDFFCLQDWVNDNYEVLDLLGDTATTLLNADVVWKENKIIPCDFEKEDEKVEKWWNLYHNLMYRLKERNKKIEEILNK